MGLVSRRYRGTLALVARVALLRVRLLGDTLNPECRPLRRGIRLAPTLVLTNLDAAFLRGAASPFPGTAPLRYQFPPGLPSDRWEELP